MLSLLKQNKLIVIIFIFVLISRLAFLSPWLEDWDSVSFALALHDYSLVDHQPHPPGYPLYVLLGRLLFFFLKDDTLSLTVLSAILGSVSVLPIYFLAKTMFDKKTALISTILFSAIPIVWLMSESALTNIPGNFFVILIALLSYQSLVSSKNQTRLVVISFFAGLILGVRFTELPIILTLLSLTIIFKHKLTTLLTSAVAFMTGVATWLLPLILITGPKEFLQSYAWIANYVLSHDSTIGNFTNIFDSITSRIGRLIYLLNIGYTPYFLLTSLLCLLLVIRKKENIKKHPYQFLLLWIGSYLFPLVLIYNLEVTRYTLPLAAPVAILTASFIAPKLKTKSLILPAFCIITTYMLYQGFYQVSKFKNNVPPSIASVNFVKNNFKPENTLIIAGYTYRQFQYYAPEFESVRVLNIDRIDNSKYETIITDFNGTKDNMNHTGKFEVQTINNFQGEPDIYTRIPEVKIYNLQRQ